MRFSISKMNIFSKEKIISFIAAFLLVALSLGASMISANAVDGYVILHFVDESGNNITGISYDGHEIAGSQFVVNDSSFLDLSEGSKIDLTNFKKDGFTLSNTHKGTWVDLGPGPHIVDGYGGQTEQIHTIIGNSLRVYNNHLQHQEFYTNSDKAGSDWYDVGYRPQYFADTRDHSLIIQEDASLRPLDYYLVYTPKTAEGSSEEDESQAPDLDAIGQTKELTNNYDGTYNLELGVRTPAESDKDYNDVNVILVVDTSSSMQRRYDSEERLPDYDTNPNSRIYQTRKSITSFTEKLMANNTSENPDAVEMALVTFNRDATIAQGWTTDLNTFNNTVNTMPTASGTNWAQGMSLANSLIGHDDNPTYVLFMTDGAPSQYWQSTIEGYYVDGEGCYLGARDEARKVTSTGAYVYGVFSYGTTEDQSSDYLGSLIDYAYNDPTAKDDYRFFVSDGTALDKTINGILRIINRNFVYTDIEIDDGITELTTVTFEDADPESFQYTISYRDYSSLTEYTDKTVNIDVSGEGNNQLITIPSITYHVVRQGAMKEITSQEQTIKGAKFINNDGEKKVIWRLVKQDNSKYSSEHDWTYKVKFKIWPSQPSYDLLAALNNGILEWGEDYTYVDNGETKTIPASNYQEQIYKSGNTYILRTNTDAFVTYYNTEETIIDGEPSYTIIGEQQKVDLPKVDGMPLDNTQIQLEKKWNTTLSDEDFNTINSVDLYVLQDNPTANGFNKNDPSTYYKKVTLRRDNNWKALVSISPGIYDQNGLLKTTGHTYSVVEPDIDNHYNLETTPTHPMLNGLTPTPDVDTSSMSEEELRNIQRDMIDVYTDPASAYDTTEDMVSRYTVANTLKGGINITKKLSLTENSSPDYNKDEQYSFEIILHDQENNPVYTENGTDGNGALGYRIYVNANDIPQGAVQNENGYEYKGVQYNAQKDNGGTITGYVARGIIGESGKILLKIRESESIRIVNVPLGTQYTVEEKDLPSEKYSFNKSEWQTRKKNPQNQEEWINVDSETITGNMKTSTHEILPDAENNVTFYNILHNPGTFTPEISKSIPNEKEKGYKKGETVQFKITVHNPETFGINNVVVKEQLAGAKFTAGDGYTVNSDTQVTIATLAAGASIDLNAEYTVTDDSVPSYTNIVEITDAKADNDWDLVCDDEHCKADEEFKTTGEFTPEISKSIPNEKEKGYKKGETVQFKITVHNPETFGINNVVVKEQLAGAKFTAGDGYTVNSDTQVTIATLAAGASIDLNAEYTVTDDSVPSYTNIVEITDAKADNDWDLVCDDEHCKADEEFKTTGEFTPEISKSIPNEKEKGYKKGETVQFKITVHNPETFGINNVVVKEQLAGAKFTAGDGYTVNSDTQVTIATLAAGASIDLNAEYTVTDDSVPSYTNIVEITDAKADNDWDLVCDDEHCKADEEFKTTGEFTPEISKSIPNEKEKGYKKGETVQFKITVHNPETFGINNVVVKEQLAGAKFTAGDGYTVNNDTQVTIATLAAGASIDLNAEYTVTDDSVPSYTNIVEITDAKADNDWDLVCDDEHCKADEEFKTHIPPVIPPKPEPKPIPESQSENPFTNDSFLTYATMIVISLSILTVALWYKASKSKI